MNDTKIELTPQQQNPYRARPEDFQITRADEAAQQRVPGHGQHGSGLKEYQRLLKQARQPGKSEWQGKGQELAQPGE